MAADDDTQSMREMEQAALELARVNADIAAKNQEIAANELERTRMAARVRKGDLEAQKEYAEAYTAFQQAVAEGEVARAEVEAQTRQIRRDQLEAELDILFDLSDRRKTIGEQEAADERVNLERRKAAITDTIADIEKSYVEIAEKISAFSGEAIDLDALLSIEDTTELNRAINELDIDEITRNRLREALIERAQAVQDLNVARRDLVDTEQEYNAIITDIAAQEELLADIEAGRIDGAEVLDSLEEKRRENRVAALREEISLAEEGSTRRAELEQELNDILLEQQQEAAQKRLEEQEKEQQAELDKAKDAAEKRAEIQRELFGALTDLSDNYFEKEQEKLDEQVEDSVAREEQLREAATEGVQNATESLAVEQQRQAELAAQQAELEKREKLAELALTALEIYQSKVEAGDENAFASTVRDVSLLRGFIEALPAFAEGTDYVDSSTFTRILPGRDGYLARVDEGERIVSARENALIPRSMTNLELAMRAQMPELPGSVIDLEPLRQDLQDVKRAITEKPAYLGRDFDVNKRIIVDTVERRGKRIREHRKVGGLFGG